MNKVLVTSAAGFIGFHLCKRLLTRGDEVIGLDNLNNYYDVNLKLARLKQIEGHENFQFIKLDIADKEGICRLFSENKFYVIMTLFNI